jgi:hypothetical protein
MSQTPRTSIAEQKEPTETSQPHRIGRRKRLDAFERGITGGHHIGHLPVYVQEIEGWSFRRCRCGFGLALTPSGAIWWLKTTKDATEINSFKSLLRALSSNCWAHPRPEPLKNAVISAPAIAAIVAEPHQPSASDSAISTAPHPALLKTRSESKAKSEDTASMPPVEKPPPAKQRRVYVPNNTTRTTRARQNPSGR